MLKLTLIFCCRPWGYWMPIVCEWTGSEGEQGFLLFLRGGGQGWFFLCLCIKRILKITKYENLGGGGGPCVRPWRGVPDFIHQKPIFGWIIFMTYKIYLVFQCFGPFEDYVNYKNCGVTDISKFGLTPSPLLPPCVTENYQNGPKNVWQKKFPKILKLWKGGLPPPPSFTDIHIHNYSYFLFIIYVIPYHE